MKHKWGDPEVKELFAGMKGKVWKCKVCGCEKSLGFYKFAVPTYVRNGQNYSDKYIECIDYEAEDLKTID